MSSVSTPLWSSEYLHHIAPDHCDDVLVGCYDIPLNFPVEKPPVILDLGANVGAFVRWAVGRWPGCELHCFEPEPKNFALLQRTVAAIPPGQAKIETYNLAVFDRDMKMVLHLATTNCGAHSFFNLGEQGAESVEVECITAAALPRGDILKLDIEGAEMAVLLALHDVGRLAEFSAIVLEFHSVPVYFAIKQLLAEQGFSLIGEKRHEKHRGELRFVKTNLLPENFIRPGQQIPAQALAPYVPSVPLVPSSSDPRPKLFIATPAHDGKFHAGFTFSLLKLVHCGKFKLTFDRGVGCGVGRARNTMAAEFLATTFPDGSRPEYYCPIDADITFNPAHLERALAFDKPIVCIPYALKQDRLQWCMNSLPGEVPDPATGFQKVSTAGTGFMVIKREVFEAMIAAYPEIEYDEDLPDAKGQKRWDFFSMGVLKRHYLTEDWYFCVRARQLGFDIWMDALNHVAHEGLISFPLEKQRPGMMEDFKDTGPSPHDWAAPQSTDFKDGYHGEPFPAAPAAEASVPSVP